MRTADLNTSPSRQRTPLRGAVLAAVLIFAAVANADPLIWRGDHALPEGQALIHEDAAFHVRTVRRQLPANQVIPPHGLGAGYAIVTLISGELELGMGEVFDEKKLVWLPAGSVFTHSTTEKHFVRTGDQPVVLQVTSITPP